MGNGGFWRSAMAAAAAIPTTAQHVRPIRRWLPPCSAAGSVVTIDDVRYCSNSTPSRGAAGTDRRQPSVASSDAGESSTAGATVAGRSVPGGVSVESPPVMARTTTTTTRMTTARPTTPARTPPDPDRCGVGTEGEIGGAGMTGAEISLPASGGSWAWPGSIGTSTATPRLEDGLGPRRSVSVGGPRPARSDPGTNPGPAAEESSNPASAQEATRFDLAASNSASLSAPCSRSAASLPISSATDVDDPLTLRM